MRMNLENFYSENQAKDFMNRYISEIVRKDIELSPKYPDFFRETLQEIVNVLKTSLMSKFIIKRIIHKLLIASDNNSFVSYIYQNFGRGLGELLD